MQAPGQLLVELVVSVVFGIVIGAIGRLLVVGASQDRAAPWIRRGLLGALLGGLIGRVAGVRAPDAATGAFLASYVGAIVSVTLYHARAMYRSAPS
jgi:uncharacterized membrane protein YeaQ/YmgE (transglycosylase-associated protein family)